jgi:hypothetical protein
LISVAFSLPNHKGGGYCFPEPCLVSSPHWHRGLDVHVLQLKEGAHLNQTGHMFWYFTKSSGKKYVKQCFYPPRLSSKEMNHLLSISSCPWESFTARLFWISLGNEVTEMTLKIFFYYHVIVLGVHCDIYKRAYNIS